MNPINLSSELYRLNESINTLIHEKADPSKRKAMAIKVNEFLIASKTLIYSYRDDPLIKGRIDQLADSCQRLQKMDNQNEEKASFDSRVSAAILDKAQIKQEKEPFLNPFEKVIFRDLDEMQTSREAIEWLKKIPKGEVRHLDLSQLEIDPDELPELLDGLTQLESLKFTSTALNDPHFKALHSLTSLKKLTLSHIANINSNNLIQVLSQLPLLKNLKLRDLDFIEENFNAMIPELSRLTGLHLFSCMGITERFLMKLAPQLSSVTNLSLSGPAVTDRVLMTLAQTLPPSSHFVL